jgi:putative ATPase
MRRHGIGVGYRNPHDFEGDDVEQQYLPERFAGKRYWFPGDQGYEVTMGQRQEARRVARGEAKPRRKRGR